MTLVAVDCPGLPPPISGIGAAATLLELEEDWKPVAGPPEFSPGAGLSTHAGPRPPVAVSHPVPRSGRGRRAFLLNRLLFARLRRTGAESTHVGGQVGRMIGTRRRGRLSGYRHPVLAGVNIESSGSGTVSERPGCILSG